ncbi:MAG: undecaprenyl-phosphate glucose phosphotransferase [Gallionella sp.]|nr:undecaprenyl-phosphate glucose phosphotransferase [Gallionella sp.]
MKSVHSGLIKPHGSKFALLHRLHDAILIFVLLIFISVVRGIGFDETYALAGAWAVLFYLLFAEARGLFISWRVESLWQEAKNVLTVWVMVLCALIVVAFFAKISSDFSRLVVGGWAIATPMSIILSRVVTRTWLRSMRARGMNTRTLAFAGGGTLASKMLTHINNSAWMGFRVVGVYDDRAAGRLTLGDLPLQGKLEDLLAAARAGEVEYVYITLPMHAEKRIIKLVDELADTTASVYIVPDFFVFDLLNARWSNVGGVPLVGVFETPFFGVDGWLKRAEDIVLGTLILMLISPILLAIGLAVKLTSPGPIIFSQRRYGLNGEIVEVWKFRSMSVCEDGDHVPQAQKNDSRITPLGAFLRRTSLDELPQFINVLQGRMSIVGPRPHAVSHNEQYRRLIHGYMLRHKVRPGITGWAQINGWRGETDTLEKMQKRVECDLYYVRNWSLWWDIKIIYKTLFKGFSGKHVY